MKKKYEAAAKQFMGVFSKFSIKGNLCNLSPSAIGRGLGLGRCPLTRQIQTSMDKDVISDSGRISTPFCNMESLQCTGYEHFERLIPWLLWEQDFFMLVPGYLKTNMV